jgi:UDP-N-acetylmuramyl pentapeptide phosphotransferase/UDP-N-acetylglucosamine-1-phosphate transferase
MNSAAASSFLPIAMAMGATACSAIVLRLLLNAPLRSAAAPGTDPQHIHRGSTSRLGGLAVFAGFLVAVVVAVSADAASWRALLPLLVAALPVLGSGLLEDVTRRTTPLLRLAGAFASAALASLLAGSVVTRFDVPLVDAVLQFAPLALALTWLMVAGACNAFNLIDGVNGLAGGTGFIAFVGLAAVAWHVGDMVVLEQALALAGALAGFLAWNYPRGRVFLGDAGAYFAGFMYAQLALQLVARNAHVSAWFVVALAAYPIAETTFSIYRRRIVNHVSAMQPDVAHLHSLLYRHYLRLALRPPGTERRRPTSPAYSGAERRQPQRRANARVAPLLWIHEVTCFVAAVSLHANTAALVGFMLLYATGYWIAYHRAEHRDAREAQRTESMERPS